MKKFSYEEWKKNPQQRIITKDGELVKRIKEEKKFADKPLYVELENGTYYYVSKDGIFNEHYLKGMDLLFDDETDIEDESELKWRKAKAGHNFGKDTVVLYNGDPDARLVRCAIYDCIYIHVEDLLKLPKE